jgi:hypothetical protein
METYARGVSIFQQGRIVLCRLPHEADLLEWLTDFALQNGMRMATFFIIGAVKKAAVAFYDQQEKKYRQIALEGNLEILSCIGNISIKEGRPFIHCHATLSDGKGETFGGHLVKGSIVFAAEAHFQEVLDGNLVRENDPVTGLALWRQD